MYQENLHDNDDFDLDEGLDLNQFEYVKTSNARNNVPEHSPYGYGVDDAYDDAFIDDEEFDPRFDDHRSFGRHGNYRNQSHISEYGGNIVMKPNPEYEARSNVFLQTLPNPRRRSPSPELDEDMPEYRRRNLPLNSQISYTSRRSNNDGRKDHYTSPRSAAAPSHHASYASLRPQSRRRAPQVSSYYDPHNSQNKNSDHELNRRSKYEETKNWVRKDSKRVSKIAKREKTKKFPSPDSKAPAIPLPDYDGFEKGVQYIPRPDY